MIGLTVSVRWHGDRFDRRIHAHLAANQDAAAELLRERVVEDITRFQGTNNRGDFYYAGGRARSRRGFLSPPEYVHSAPWQSPYWVTRELADSYRAAPTGGGKTAALYSADPKSLWLELGTRHMLPRPHLLPALYMHRAAIAGTWCAPMP